MDNQTLYSIMLIEDPKKYYYNYFITESKWRDKYISDWGWRCENYIGFDVCKWGEGGPDYDFFTEFPYGLFFSPTAIFTTISKDVCFKSEAQKLKTIKYLVLKHNLSNPTGNYFVPFTKHIGKYVFGLGDEEEFVLHRKISREKEQQWVNQFEKKINGQPFKLHFDILYANQK